jgi:hypothetical protein
MAERLITWCVVWLVALAMTIGLVLPGRNWRSAILVGVAIWALGRFGLAWKAPYITAIACSALVYVALAWWRNELDVDRPR